jgi:arylsulfatase A-like enzyme
MAPLRSWKLERDIPASVTTLFQHVDGLADVNTWFVRGCPAGARRTRFSKAAAFVRSFATKDWYASDGQAERAVLGALAAGFPSAFAVFPAIDELSHRHGPLAEETFEAYRRFDRVLGRIFDALARRRANDRTLVMLTSDHGQSTTHTHVDLDGLVRRVYPRAISYPKIWRHLLSADAAVMVSGNAMANLYLAGAGGWSQRLDVERDGRASELLGRLLEHPSIDHVLYRDAGAFVAASARATARIERVGEDALRYSVAGGDPFGYRGLPATMSKRAALALTVDSDYPDAPWQIAEFFRSSRAGDLVVCARPGYDLRAHFEYQPHLGSHGGLHREHMLIPAAVTTAWGGKLIRSVDLFPTLLVALGKPVPSAVDGEPIALGGPDTARRERAVR